jgi:hypothetical protein
MAMLSYVVALEMRFSWVVVLPGSMRVLAQSAIFGAKSKHGVSEIQGLPRAAGGFCRPP